MTEILNQIKKYIPEDVLNRLPRKKFNAGETILNMENNYFLILLDGTAHSVRYQDNKKIIYPYLWKKGCMVGFNMLLSKGKKNWEFVAISPVLAIIFTPEVIEKYIFQAPSSFKFFVESNMYILEAGLKGFYVLAHGGAKAYLALLLIEGSQNRVFHFKRYENFADTLGISKSMLFRITRDLIDKEVILKKRKKVIILKPEALKDLYREYLYF